MMEALNIVDRLEQEIVRQELAFGRERLLRTISSFGSEAYVTHTAYYRRVIRETTWPHGKWVGGMHTDFLRGFEYSSLGYVWAGFESLRFFAGAGGLSIDQVYEDALIAESLRGQFGKSSPDGLDRRLMDMQEEFLTEYGDEEDLILLCTPMLPIRPAETALVEDFADFRTLFPLPPTIDDILGLPARLQVKAWQFLRRYVRWNAAAAALLYDKFHPASVMSRATIQEEQHVRRRDLALRKLSESAVTLVDSITSLNVLNLVLEPAFSFKGCVGFPLGMVFRSVNHVEQRPALDQVSILLGKMNLFTLAQQRNENEK
jgi:hypothetical protein